MERRSKHGNSWERVELPKIVNHDQRRREIALAALRALKNHGLENVTVAHIAAEAGSTSGMIAHYYPTKLDVILAALHLMHERLEAKLQASIDRGSTNCERLLSEALPFDSDRAAEIGVWLSFWAFTLNRPPLLEASRPLDEDWHAVIRKALLACYPELSSYPKAKLDQEIAMLVVFLDGLAMKGLLRPENYDSKTARALLRTYLSRFGPISKSN